MRGLLSAAGHVPYHRLRREAIPASVGGTPATGTRAVASWDEDATTLAVAAARLAVAASDVQPTRLTFSSATAPYVDKTNATAIHAALRLPPSVRAHDASGAPRSALASLLAALEGTQPTLVTAADVRSGPPGGPDERETGDAGAAILVGDAGDGPLVAELLGQASATAEFLDRWSAPGQGHTQRWEERFGETQYVPLAEQAAADALAAAGMAITDVDHLLVTGLHARATKRAATTIAAGRDIVVDDLTDEIGNSGSAHGLLLLAHVLETAVPGAVIALVVLADGCDAVLFRATGEGRSAARSVRSQIDHHDDTLDYLRFLTWRGQVIPEPPRRPAPARASAPASARASDWKFGFTGSRDESSGGLHLPPARVARDGGAIDDMAPTPMADVQATIRTFTVDHLSWSPSPPTVFAVLDFEDGAGRYACALTDVEPDAVRIGDRVEMTFRRLGEADGVVNYFWKARPVPGSAGEG